MVSSLCCPDKQDYTWPDIGSPFFPPPILWCYSLHSLFSLLLHLYQHLLIIQWFNTSFSLLSIFVFVIYSSTGSSLWCTGFLIFVITYGIFSWGIWTLSCNLWDLVPWPGMEPGPPALGVWSPSHWTTREVPVICLSHKHDCTVGPVIPPST